MRPSEEWRTCPRCGATYLYYPELPFAVRQDLCELCVDAVRDETE